MRENPLGTPRLHLRATTSTNDRAQALAAAGATHGTLVTTAEQTAGRGRQGRRWHAPASRALLLSLVLRDPPTLLPLAAAVAVADVVGPSATIKWPNDVMLDGRKVAGILVEARPQEGWAVLGIGVNVAVDPASLPAELRATAGALGRDPRRIEDVLGTLMAALHRVLGAAPSVVLAAYRARDALVGRDVTWAAGSGRAAGVDDAGRLLVTLADGARTALEAGEVHLTGAGERP